jgi:orotidine-5'-phosphate decarboxylase
MTDSFFLIPGLGAQGAGALDAVAGFGSRNGKKGGALVNASRGLLTGESKSLDELMAVIRGNVDRFNQELRAALQST